MCETLYRPVGLNELCLIEEFDFRTFPPRLIEQPIFYPVLNEQYAIQIARDWNAKNSKAGVGYVTRFRVASAYLHEVPCADSRKLNPSEILDSCGRTPRIQSDIVGLIEVIHEFRKQKEP